MSLSRTADAVVLQALRTLGIYQPGSALSAEDGDLGRTLLAEMVDSWNTQRLTVLAQDRTVYDLVADQGGPDDPYTIGPGGDFDTGTAARPVEIRAANLLLTTDDGDPVEIPLAILTDQMQQAQQIKALSSSTPATLYYRPTVPLGQIQLWNIPDTAANQLVLYTDLLTPQFVGASTVYVCPPGYAKAFRLGVAYALIPFFGVDGATAQRVTDDFREAMTDLKTQNAPMSDLAADPAYLSNSHGSYIIQTDTGA